MTKKTKQTRHRAGEEGVAWVAGGAPPVQSVKGSPNPDYCPVYVITKLGYQSAKTKQKNKGE